VHDAEPCDRCEDGNTHSSGSRIGASVGKYRMNPTVPEGFTTM
jgi:hypothetical protein